MVENGIPVVGPGDTGIFDSDESKREAVIAAEPYILLLFQS